MERATIHGQLTVTRQDDCETVLINQGPHEMDWVEIDREEASELAAILTYFAVHGTLPKSKAGAQ